MSIVNYIDSKRNGFSSHNNNMDHWHHRLEHHLDNVLQYSNMFPYIYFYKDEACKSCQLSKQHKFLFIQNNAISIHIHDLIHIDI